MTKLGKRQRDKTLFVARVESLRGPRLWRASLEVTRIRGVEREVIVSKRLLRRDFDGPTDLLQSFREISQLAGAVCQIVVRGSVGRVLVGQRAELLDTLLRVSDQPIVNAAGSVPFSLRHAVNMGHYQFEVRLSLLELAHVSVNSCDAGIGSAEIGVEFQGFGERLLGFAVFSGRRKIQGHAII